MLHEQGRVDGWMRGWAGGEEWGLPDLSSLRLLKGLPRAQNEARFNPRRMPRAARPPDCDGIQQRQVPPLHQRAAAQRIQEGHKGPALAGAGGGARQGGSHAVGSSCRPMCPAQPLERDVFMENGRLQQATVAFAAVQELLHTWSLAKCSSSASWTDSMIGPL